MSQLIHTRPKLPSLNHRRASALVAVLLVVAAAITIPLAVSRDDAAPAPVPALGDVVGDVSAGVRYDGGPEEGRDIRLRRSAAPVAPGRRYDGGPDEGSRGPGR